jgi:predicted Zn-dependent protease
MPLNPSNSMLRRHYLRPFAACIVTIAAAGGCGADGQMDPAVSGVLGSISGGKLSSGSKEMQLASAGAKAGQSLTLSDADAAEIGESIAVAVTESYGVVADEKLNAYVAKVGLTIASVADAPEQNFTFGVLDTDEVNALSMPGGYVFVTRGAVARMKDEAELAGVLAHEVAHVCDGHGKEAIKRAKGMDALATGASAYTPSMLGQVVDASFKEVQKPMGQGEETKADVTAIKYLKAAGYDPAAYLRYLERSQLGGKGMFPTHPSNASRVAKVKSAIGAQAGGQTLADRFAANTASVARQQ